LLTFETIADCQHFYGGSIGGHRAAQAAAGDSPVRLLNYFLSWLGTLFQNKEKYNPVIVFHTPQLTDISPALNLPPSLLKKEDVLYGSLFIFGEHAKVLHLKHPLGPDGFCLVWSPQCYKDHGLPRSLRDHDR
jgi:hypothetical protein